MASHHDYITVHYIFCNNNFDYVSKALKKKNVLVLSSTYMYIYPPTSPVPTVYPHIFNVVVIHTSFTC